LKELRASIGKLAVEDWPDLEMDEEPPAFDVDISAVEFNLLKDEEVWDDPPLGRGLDHSSH